MSRPTPVTYLSNQSPPAAYAEIRQTDYCTWGWWVVDRHGTVVHGSAALTHRAATRRARRALRRYERRHR